MNKSINDKGFGTIRKSVCKYEKMLKEEVSNFFDVAECEDIVDYYLFSNKFAEAISAMNFALRLHPNSVKIKLKKIHFLIDRRKFETAFDMLSKIQREKPYEPEVYYLFGAIYIEKSNSEVAEKFFLKSISLGFDDENIIAGMGFLLEQGGFYKSAIIFFKKAYKKAPKNLFILYEIAYCYEKVGKFNSSIKFYENYLEEDPYSENAWYNIGVAAEKLMDYEKAMQAFQYAVAIAPNFNDALLAKADLLRKTENYLLAIPAYEEIYSTDKNNKTVIKNIIECYKDIQNFEKADYYFKLLQSII